VIESLRHYDADRLAALVKALDEEVARLQAEAAGKQRIADRARKELKRRRHPPMGDRHVR
jgi:hypothetical protein